MFVAKNQKGEQINLLRKKQKVQGPFFCPACQQEVMLKQGAIKQAHFAHLSNQACIGSEPETAEHLAGKALLAKWCEDQGHKVEVEPYLPALSQRPDLLINEKIALEFQCSAISLARFKERTHSYQKHGYQVIWLLGKKLQLNQQLNHQKKKFCYFQPELGYYMWELDVEQQCCRLRFGIEKRYGDQQSSSFYKEWQITADFLSILKFPTQNQFFGQRFVDIADYQKRYRTCVQRQLYYRNSTWLKLQEICYLKHGHLLMLPDYYFFPYPECFFIKEPAFKILLEVIQPVLRKNTSFLTVEALLQQFKIKVQTGKLTLIPLPNCEIETLIDYYFSQLLKLLEQYQKFVNKQIKQVTIKVTQLKIKKKIPITIPFESVLR